MLCVFIELTAICFSSSKTITRQRDLLNLIFDTNPQLKLNGNEMGALRSGRRPQAQFDELQQKYNELQQKYTKLQREHNARKHAGGSLGNLSTATNNTTVMVGRPHGTPNTVGGQRYDNNEQTMNELLDLSKLVSEHSVRDMFSNSYLIIDNFDKFEKDIEEWEEKTNGVKDTLNKIEEQISADKTDLFDSVHHQQQQQRGDEKVLDVNRNPVKQQTFETHDNERLRTAQSRAKSALDSVSGSVRSVSSSSRATAATTTNTANGGSARLGLSSGLSNISSGGSSTSSRQATVKRFTTAGGGFGGKT